MSDCLLATLSVRPHLLRQQILLQDYFSVGREYIFIRNLDSRHSTFRLVLQFPARMCFRSQTTSALHPCPSAKQKGRLRQSSMPVPTWGGSMNSVRASALGSLSWLLVPVCLPQGNYVNGNQTIAKQLEKTAFPAAVLWFQVSLPPTTSPHPTLLL